MFARGCCPPPTNHTQRVGYIPKVMFVRDCCQSATKNTYITPTLRSPGSYGEAFQAWHFARLSPAAHVLVSLGDGSLVASFACTYLGWFPVCVKPSFVVFFVCGIFNHYFLWSARELFRRASCFFSFTVARKGEKRGRKAERGTGHGQDR